MRALWLAMGMGFLVSGASAQAPASRPLLSLGAGAAWFRLGGADFDGIDDGARLEAYAGYRAAHPLDVKGGIHYSRHRMSSGFDLSLLGLYVEPRLVFERRGAPVAGFLGIRGGWVRRSAIDLSSTGFSVGGTVGLQVGTSWPVRVEPAITASFLSVASPFAGGGERDTGSAIGIHLGVSVPFANSGS